MIKLFERVSTLTFHTCVLLSKRVVWCHTQS